MSKKMSREQEKAMWAKRKAQNVYRKEYQGKHVKYEIKKRTFEAKNYPKGSLERKELNKDALTSEYNPSEKYYVYKNGIKDDGYATLAKAERAVEIDRKYGGDK